MIAGRPKKEDKKKKDKKEQEPEVEEKNSDDQEEQNILMEALATAQKPVHMTGLYGDVNETKAQEAVYSMLLFQKDIIQSIQGGVPPEEIDPIEFYVSTFGGQASEMFAVYDVMRMVRDKVPVMTVGIGKVMSAGVLLLASGTKGMRKIGKHCRVMIHGVNSGHSGYIADMENEFNETKFTQKQYVAALAAETDMTPAYIRKLMGKKTNVYLDAQQAVDLGIADIIV